MEWSFVRNGWYEADVAEKRLPRKALKVHGNFFSFTNRHIIWRSKKTTAAVAMQSRDVNAFQHHIGM